MPVQLKRDPYLWAFAVVLVIATMSAVYAGHATMREAAALIIGALAMPGLFGTRKKEDDNHDGGVTVPVDVPGPSVQKIGEKSLPAIITPITMILVLAGCSASPQEKAAAADATYTADHLACVDEAKTLAESKACRAKVRAAWHVDGGAVR